MKKLLLIPLLFLAYASFAQLPVVRGPDGVTVEDYRAYFLKNFRLPVFSDTTAANVAKGLDSVGTMISIRGTDTVYIRAQSTGAFHKWTPISGTGGGGGGTDTIFVTPIGTAAGMIQTLYAVDGNLRVSNWGPGYGTLPFLAGDSLAYIDIDTSSVAYKAWVIAQFGPGGPMNQTLQQTFNTEVGGSLLTKIDTIMMKGTPVGLQIIDSSSAASTAVQILGRNTHNHGTLFVGNSTGAIGSLVNFSNVGTAATLTAGSTNAASTAATVSVTGAQTNVTSGVLTVTASGGSNALNGSFAPSGGTTSSVTATTSAVTGQSVTSKDVAAFSALMTTIRNGDTAIAIKLFHNPVTANEKTNASIGIASMSGSTTNAKELTSLIRTITTDTIAASFTSSWHLGLANAGAGVTDKFVLSGNGALKLTGYGSGTKTGTATYALSVDASGNVIETTAGGGGGSGDAIGRDTVQTYTSGTTLTQGTSTNYIQVDPASVQATLTITTLASGGTWHTSNDLYIVFGGTVTSGNPVLTSVTITAGSGLTLVQANNPNGLTYNAGEILHYHRIGNYLYRIN